MTVRDEPPVGAGDLDLFAAGLPPEQAALAHVLVGAAPGDVGRWRATADSWPATATEPIPFVRWAPTWHALAAPPATVLAQPVAVGLGSPLDPDGAYDRQPPPIRLTLGEDVDPLEVSARLLAHEGVASVVVPLSRPARTLRPRPWNWPLRVGTFDARLTRATSAAGAWSAASPRLPRELLDVVDASVDRRALDVLLVEGSLEETVSLVRDRRPVSNVLVVAGPTGGPWPVAAANLAMLRAVTGAVAVAVVPRRPRQALANALRWVVYLTSHGHVLDVALTAAFERDLLLAAELDALAGASLPLQVGRRARELREDLDRAVPTAGAAPPPAPAPPTGARDIDFDFALPPSDAAVSAQLDELERLDRGDFSSESQAATRARELSDALDRAVEDAAAERTLQVRVHPHGTPASPRVQHSLVAGANDVDVFVGPIEVDAIQGLAMTNEQLGFTATSTTVRLTAVLVPLQPAGPAVRMEFDVPRTGRSETATLPWSISPDVRSAQARLLLMHRNRVVQTGLLGGDVGKGPVTLTERIVLWDGFGNLDDRQPFDAALVLNHDRRGKPRAVAHANGRTVVIPARQELSGPTERIRQILVRASAIKGTGKPAGEAVRQLFVDVAVEGKRLHNYIAGAFDSLENPRHIQIVTTRPTWFLPLELVYDRTAPDDDAVLCPHWVAGDECGDACLPVGKEHTIVCPHAFWGMSRIIERHWMDLSGAAGEDEFRVSASPKHRRNQLTTKGAVVAASKRIATADLTRTLAAFGDGAVAAKSWAEWEAAVADAKRSPNLLVILPHTDAKADTMEIAGDPLRGGRVDAVRHVTGGRDTNPVVVLFGCDTAGSVEDPAGWATLFMQMKAGLVFATLTMLLNRHAAELTQRLAAELLAPRRTARPLGEVVTTFRREAVRGGLIAALSVTAYGDSDWRL